MTRRCRHGREFSAMRPSTCGPCVYAMRRPQWLEIPLYWRECSAPARRFVQRANVSDGPGRSLDDIDEIVLGPDLERQLRCDWHPELPFALDEACPRCVTEDANVHYEWLTWLSDGDTP